MSVLLKALKKSEDKEADAAAKKQPSAAAAADFDGLDDPSPQQQTAADGSSDPQGKQQRVDAARVFDANEQETKPGTSIARKMLGMVVVAVATVGGVYGVLKLELFPGFDLSLFETLGIGGGGVLPPPVEISAAAGETQQQDAAEVGALPFPKVDVQSEIDIDSFRQPADAAGDADEYRRHIANLTGYDVESEQQRLREEELALRGDTDPLAEALAESLSEDDAEGAAFVTAEESRQAKAELAKKTPWDLEINIAYADGEPLPNQPQPVEDVAGENPAPASEGATDETDITSAGGIAAAVVGLVEAATGEDAPVDEPAVVAAVVPEPAAPTTPAPTASAEPEPSGGQGSVEVDKSQAGIIRKNRLQDARDLYHTGDIKSAETIYRDVLREDEANIDALRGLASLATATGRQQLAFATYLDLLSYYPEDPVAIAEITNLRGGSGGNTDELVRDLKSKLGKHSRAVDGILHFTLGNLYAENNRWLDAQEAYFQAFANNASHPDYAYNLAVVLDYLNKPALARQYYREALDLSEGLKVGFNRARVRARIADLN